MAKSIMIMGTMSSAGKSFVTAGLCRVFQQDGFKTAPFKSQNMALNSYITEDQLEMGRAQVMQAEAAGIVPDVRMNPILLKPTSENGSQVIVNGNVFSTMTAKEYYRHKSAFVPVVQQAYASLAQEYDIIVLEGAGSPAEINLKQVDIVNMGMAEISDSPVILVGDIDRGGVFASLYGTVALLDEKERQRIRGFIINKFRGDDSILQPGIVMLEQLTGISVLGVLPYADIHLDEEDSLSERLLQQELQEHTCLDIAVIKFPKISNFTDMHILESISSVSVRYVSSLQELRQPDMILLPGTKSTVADLLWMRQNGLEAGILKAHEKGCLLFGICGGFQMLGRQLTDTASVEYGGVFRGMQLLDTETIFHTCKQTAQVQGRIPDMPSTCSALSGMRLTGYEIHMGQTCGTERAFVILDNGETAGYCNQAQTVFGTYLHGIFDNQAFTEQFLRILLDRKYHRQEKNRIPFSEIHVPDAAAYKQQQYQKLEQCMRENLDMSKIYHILETWQA